jgi:hypothetical protein
MGVRHQTHTCAANTAPTKVPNTLNPGVAFMQYPSAVFAKVQVWPHGAKLLHAQLFAPRA